MNDAWHLEVTKYKFSKSVASKVNFYPSTDTEPSKI